MGFSNIQNKYSKSLSWAWNLNKLVTVMEGYSNFKFRIVIRNIYFWNLTNTSHFLKGSYLYFISYLFIWTRPDLNNYWKLSIFYSMQQKSFKKPLYNFKVRELVLNKMTLLCLLRYLVFCYQNCTDLLWEKIVLLIEKKFWNSRLKAENFQKFWDY